MKRLDVLFLCLALLAPLACRSPVGQGVPLPASDPRPQHLMEGLSAQAPMRTALQGAARLSIDAKDLSFNRPQRMAVEKPGRLRVEVLGLFDQVAALVVTREQSFQFFDARTGRVEEGPVDPEILWRVARIDLSPEEAVGLILGSPSGQEGFRVAEAMAFQDGSIAFSRLDDRDIPRERYVFDEVGRLVEVQRVSESGGLIWRARYSDFRTVDRVGGEKISFAFDVRLDFPRVEAQAKLAFKQVRLPDALPDALFELPRRVGARSGLTSDLPRTAGVGS